MAKISSYPSDANVTTSDRLIGSDNENSNETKNFQIGDIINLAASIILPQVASVYVPYAGATSDVILGTNEIYAGAGYFPDIYTTNINPNIGVSLISIGADVDLGAYTLSTSYLTSNLGIFIDGVNGAISLDGDEGLTGEFLVSQGPGATPSWTNPSSVFVPYTGATGNVDLGTYNLIADNVQANIFQLNSGGILGLYGTVQLNGSPGTAGQVLTSSGGGVPTWTSLSGTYVPYTGATGNVDLGSNSLDADVINAGDVYANNLFNAVGNPSVFIGNDAAAPVGLSINTSTNVFKLGDYNGNFNATNISIEDGLSRITFVGGFNLSNGQGTAGQILRSNGAGLTPSWVNAPSTSGLVPYTGATNAVNLGIYSMTAANIAANNFVPILGGTGNTFFGGAGGYGVARNGVYALGTDVTILGDSLPGSSTHIEIDGPNNSIVFNNGYVSFSNISGLYLINGFGSTGQILISSGAGSAPIWSSAPELATNTFWKGSFYDTITQTLTGGANVEVPVILRTTDAPATNGISIVTDGTNLSRITFSNSGTYNILFSAQLSNSGGTGQTVDFWLRKNGSTAAANIANTNGKVFLQGNASHVMAAWNYFVTVNSGDYIQLMWTATSTNITMVYEAANAVHPATPSVILTANIV